MGNNVAIMYSFGTIRGTREQVFYHILNKILGLDNILIMTYHTNKNSNLKH